MYQSRFFFKRKSGYMSPYKLRQALEIIRTYPGRGLPLAPLYVRVGRRYIRLTKGS